ncbi:mannose-6-phosphate isomerase [Aspergillus arachidicola]|uniref:Mannose-6-phosphate isomerase n=1 Tax=Aspergillus arachidicola TaxID=656916 RepID=A0A2G7FUS5_9EURO|nr:mannose-6-phosphate isomerase [Aspergillus arachidicola]
MIVALTPFEALCGFRPLKEVDHFLSSVPPLQNLISDATAMEVRSACGSAGDGRDQKSAEIALKRAWSELLTAHPSRVRSCAEDLIRFATSRPSNESLAVEHGNLTDLILQLSEHYPHDVGLFAVLFMNHVCLSPGEALFVRSNELHAYLSGDGIECMASSANVVRAGFSRKTKDVDTLISMLTYEYLPPFVVRTPTPYLRVEMSPQQSTSVLYESPAEEFNIIKTSLAPRFATANFRAFRGPTVLICTQGSGKIGVGDHTELIECGHVFFAGAGAEIFIQSSSRSPMAEGVFRNMAASHPLINEIDSAGTGAYHTHEPPDPRTMSTLRQHGIKNYNHAARKVTKEDFLTFDYLMAMDKYNLRDLLDVRESVIASLSRSKKGTRAASGEAGAKVAEVRLFGDFGAGGKLHERVGGGEVVQDPYYGGVNGFEEVYQQVVRFSKGFLDYLEKNQGSEDDN